MCFSAAASLTSSGVIASIGLTSSNKLKSKKDRALALIPFIFAIQQGIEGLVWLNVGNEWEYFWGYAFVLISHLFWPTFVPIAFYLQETVQSNRQILKYLIPVGLFTGIYLGIFLLLSGLNMEIPGNNISYFYDVFGGYWIAALYLIATILPALFSSSKTLKLFGITLAASFLISFAFYEQALFSVWCFFAALLSVLIVVHFSLEDRKNSKLKG